MSKDKCFIIMPLTTHPEWVEHYENDADHFRHVLEDLFCPAVEQAGFEPVPPLADGADVIHAKVIKEIESSALVLCDMSRLNPNVFFELGIRTAVGKPMCLVVDDKTRRHVPFDVGIVNYHEYQSSLASYVIKKELPKLVDHIQKSAKNSGGKNTLWEQFGLHAKAALPAGGSALDAKVEVLTSKVEALAKALTPAPRGVSSLVVSTILALGEKYSVALSVKADVDDENLAHVTFAKIPGEQVMDELAGVSKASGTILRLSIKGHKRPFAVLFPKRGTVWTEFNADPIPVGDIPPLGGDPGR
jgi:hypothetical protein